jgi:hypothetical protein
MHQHRTTIAISPPLDLDPAPDPVALHVDCGIWRPSCTGCGFELAGGWRQDRVECKAARPSCPLCQESPNARNGPGRLGAVLGMDDTTLAEQIAHLRQLIARLRQLAVTDPGVGVLDLAIIDALEELAEALQERRGNDPPRELGSV